MFHKSKFTNSDDNEIIEGYTDGTDYNGWANVYFTREQLPDAVGAYDVRFYEANTRFNKRNYPVAVVFFEDELIIESSLIIITDGDIIEEIEAYALDGFEFIEVDNG